MANYYDVNFIERFIRQEAVKRGINPDIAVRVARSEGLGPGIWQSRLPAGSGHGAGGREASYGPFQLYTGGLGRKYEQVTGHEVEDPRYVTEQVKFALDEAARGGWTPWHGWKGAKWAGIRTPATGEVAAGDVGGLARGSKMAAQDYDPTSVETGESGPIASTSTPPDSLGDMLGDELQGDDRKKSLGGLLAEMSKPAELMSVPALPIGGGGGGSNVQSLPEYIQQYIAMRMQGGGGGQGGQGFG